MLKCTEVHIALLLSIFGASFAWRISEEKIATAAMAKELEQALAESPRPEDRKGIDRLLLGRYEFAFGDKNFSRVLNALGFDKELIEHITQSKDCLISFTKKESVYTFWRKCGDLHSKTHFEPGQEFADTLLDGRAYKGKFTFKEDDKLIREETYDGLKVRVVTVLHEGGFSTYYNAAGQVSARKYTRLQEKTV